MSQLKYAQYILTEPFKPLPRHIKKKETQLKSGNFLEATHLMRLEDTLVQGASYTDCVWIWGKKGAEPVESEIAHTHDFDEVLGLVGSRREDPFALGGEIEFWLEDEQYILTKSCLIFVPRELKHCPLRFRRVDSPIFFFTWGQGSNYTRTSGRED
jgi:hypothetical protein